MNLSILDYERLNANIYECILTFEGESVLVRQPFRWMKNGEVVPNAYECLDLEQICEERNWKIIAKYGDSLAIISESFQ